MDYLGMVFSLLIHCFSTRDVYEHKEASNVIKYIDLPAFAKLLNHFDRRISCFHEQLPNLVGAELELRTGGWHVSMPS